MRVCIFGAGAIGGMLGFLLNRQGYDVTLQEALAYLKASIAVHSRDFYVKHRRRQ